MKSNLTEQEDRELDDILGDLQKTSRFQEGYNAAWYWFKEVMVAIGSFIAMMLFMAFIGGIAMFLFGALVNGFSESYLNGSGGGGYDMQDNNW